MTREDDTSIGGGERQQYDYAIGLTLQHFSLRTVDDTSLLSDVASQLLGHTRFHQRDEAGELREPLRRKMEVRALALYWDPVAVSVAPTATEGAAEAGWRGRRGSAPFSAATAKACEPVNQGFAATRPRTDAAGKRELWCADGRHANLSDPTLRKLFRDMVEGEVNVKSFGRSAQHHYVVSPCTVAVRMIESCEKTLESARGKTVPAVQDLEVEASLLDISLDEGQYTALVKLLFYLEWCACTLHEHMCCARACACARICPCAYA